LKLAIPALDPFVIPITVLILALLFAFQRRATTGIGFVFGPLMLVWFSTLALLGITGIVGQPRVLAAVIPVHGIHFFLDNHWRGFLVLGAVFLVVTGGEALYADMGHFTRPTIRFAWFTPMLPALVLNYFGQGALLLVHPERITQPFYLLAPGWALYPMVVIASTATVIASQAVICGVFSLTRQAAFLGLFPHVRIVQASRRANRPDLHPCRQLASYDRYPLAGIQLSHLEQRRRRLWGRGIHHHGHHYLPCLWSGSRTLAVELSLRSSPYSGILGCRSCFFRREYLQDHRRGMDSPARRRAGFFPDVHMETRPGDCKRAPGRVHHPPGYFCEENYRQTTCARTRHSHFHVRKPKGYPPMLLRHLELNQVLHERVILLTVVIEDAPRVWPNYVHFYPKFPHDRATT
jgi:hypothetical protein